MYLVLHLAGNALIFFGQEAFNEYAHTLISNPLVVPIEIGLLLIFLLHIYKTVRMWLANQAARPVGYAKKATGRAHEPQERRLDDDDLVGSGDRWSSWSSTSSSSSSAAFYLVAGSDAVRDLYRTEIEVFQQPLWVAFYVICTLLVGLHLRHGIASAFQSLGLDHPLTRGRSSRGASSAP